jgi:radical SAM protein with 4Fe4S-binding SPASM domain
LIDDSVISHGGFHPDYVQEKEYFNKNKIYSIQIESTTSCHQGCLYCYASDEKNHIKELPRENILSVLNSAAKMEVKAIDWLGGDPLLRSDWYELMKFALNKGLKNNIWTSGMPLENMEIARKAVEVSKEGFISVHLDSLDENIYGKLHTGNPKKKITAILRGVDNVQSFDKKPEHMINCITLTKPIVEDVQKTIKFFFNVKGMRTCLTQLCITGLAEEHHEWVPSIKEIKDACEIRDKINYPDSSLSMSSMDTNKFYCGGIICVTIDGDVTPCSVIREGFGNIYESSLEEIVEKYRDKLLLTHLRKLENMPGNCKTCKNNSICWGCRATAYYEYGDLFASDPKCYKINKDNSK